MTVIMEPETILEQLDAALARTACGGLDALAFHRGHPVGLKRAAAFLAGRVVDPEAIADGVTGLELYGALRFLSMRQVRDLFEELLARGLVVRDEGPVPLLHLSRTGEELVDGEEGAAPGVAAAMSLGWVPPSVADLPRYRALRRMRRQLAATEAVPAYRVLTNRALASIAATDPETREELVGVHGVGEATVERHGQAILRALEEARAEEAAIGVAC